MKRIFWFICAFSCTTTAMDLSCESKREDGNLFIDCTVAVDSDDYAYSDDYYALEYRKDKLPELPETLTNGTRYILSPTTVVSMSETEIVIRRTLNITNLVETDTGIYKCALLRDGVVQTETIAVVLAKRFLSVAYEQRRHVAEENSTVTLTITYQGDIDAYDFTLNEEPLEHHRFLSNETCSLNQFPVVSCVNSSTIVLQVNKICIEKAGNYVVTVKSRAATASASTLVCVKAGPFVEVTPEEVYVKENTKLAVNCKVTGYPRSDVNWKYKKCKIDEWQECTREPLNQLSHLAKYDRHIPPPRSEFIQDDKLNIDSIQSGIIACNATQLDSLRNSIAFIKVMVGDLDEKFLIWRDDPEAMIVAGDHLVLHCGAIKHIYQPPLVWLHNDAPIDLTQISVTETLGNVSYHSTLVIENARQVNSGAYKCQATSTLDGTVDDRVVDIVVHIPAAPTIQYKNFNTTNVVNFGVQVELICNFSGAPQPKIDWYKGKELLTEPNPYDIHIVRNRLVIYTIMPDHAGEYRCVATNALGHVEHQGRLLIEEMNFSQVIVIIGIVLALTVLLAIITIILYIRNVSNRGEINELKRLSSLLKSTEKSFGPGQIDLLPYDKKFEFRREKLVIEDTILGDGEFGVVKKARARGISGYEEETTVAVKMPKSNADFGKLEALIAELKILMNVGHHLNIVKFLGAITTEIKRRELVIIVEYCRYGNLQKFLQKRRTTFDDQINQETGEIECESTEPDLSADEYSSGYVKILHDESIRTINTTDLVFWAVQIARGMDYLASRKILHGDLAARNVLLTDDKVVKICDFGLAKSLYYRTHYVKGTSGPLPLPYKWLAIESLNDFQFSVYTDVWAFGVTVWELFSLGRMPYTDIVNIKELIERLGDGYRLECPKFANAYIHSVMTRCWAEVPEQRPLFHELERKLTELLPTHLREMLENLNEMYLDPRMIEGDVKYTTNEKSPSKDPPQVPTTNTKSVTVEDVKGQ